jgi:hypothetical protein
MSVATMFDRTLCGSRARTEWTVVKGELGIQTYWSDTGAHRSTGGSAGCAEAPRSTGSKVVLARGGARWRAWSTGTEVQFRVLDSICPPSLMKIQLGKLRPGRSDRSVGRGGKRNSRRTRDSYRSAFTQTDHVPECLMAGPNLLKRGTRCRSATLKDDGRAYQGWNALSWPRGLTRLVAIRRMYHTNVSSACIFRSKS